MKRLMVLMILALLAPMAAAVGQEGETPWQQVVSAQIEAFRAGDGAAALELAGAGFREQFTDPALFYATIVGLGYGPLVNSRSHSFGEFARSDEHHAMQVVRLVGPDQGLYEAVYQMGEEPDLGWRVEGVVLRKQEGVGI